MTASPPQDTVPSAEPPAPSLLGRVVAVFARPVTAWGGLRERAQWWFPMLLMVLVVVASSTAVYDRAIVPMQMDQIERQAADGEIPPDRVEAIHSSMTNPVVKGIGIAVQGLSYAALSFIAALVVWFGIGFVMGTKFSYRLALEVVCWASLIRIPETLLVTAMAWVRETFVGVHAGFGVLLPVTDRPDKLAVGLGIVLDAIGPLSIWYVAVAVLGAAALSGAPRKSVAWTLGGLYLGVMVFFAALAALLTPGP